MSEPNEALDEILIDFASFFNFDPMLVKPEPFNSELAAAKAKLEALIRARQIEARDNLKIELLENLIQKIGYQDFTRLSEVSEWAELTVSKLKGKEK